MAFIKYAINRLKKISTGEEGFHVDIFGLIIGMILGFLTASMQI